MASWRASGHWVSKYDRFHTTRYHNNLAKEQMLTTFAFFFDAAGGWADAAARFGILGTSYLMADSARSWNELSRRHE